MNACCASRSLCWLLLFILAAGCLHLGAAPGFAADGPGIASSSLQANFIFDLVSDRARFIQVSLIFVVVGIWLLWWNR